VRQVESKAVLMWYKIDCLYKGSFRDTIIDNALRELSRRVVQLEEFEMKPIHSVVCEPGAGGGLLTNTRWIECPRTRRRANSLQHLNVR
jgi:hypothetical protein